MYSLRFCNSDFKIDIKNVQLNNIWVQWGNRIQYSLDIGRGDSETRFQNMSTREILSKDKLI